MKKTITILTMIMVLSMPLLALEASKSSSDKYWKWRNAVTWETEDAYYIPKHTIVSNTRKNVISGFNHILQNNGQFNKEKMKWTFNCGVLQGWSIGTIIEENKNSNVVKVRYHQPFSGRTVVEHYIPKSMITTLANYRKSAAH